MKHDTLFRVSVLVSGLVAASCRGSRQDANNTQKSSVFGCTMAKRCPVHIPCGELRIIGNVYMLYPYSFVNSAVCSLLFDRFTGSAHHGGGSFGAYNGHALHNTVFVVRTRSSSALQGRSLPDHGGFLTAWITAMTNICSHCMLRERFRNHPPHNYPKLSCVAPLRGQMHVQPESAGYEWRRDHPSQHLRWSG